MSETIRTRDFYDQAIDRLDALVVVEPSSEKRKQIYQQIARLRHEMIDAAFDSIASRTPLLQSLIDELQQAIATASNVPSVAGAITDLTALVTGVQSAIGTVTGAIGAVTGATRGVRGRKRTTTTATATGAPGGEGPVLKVLCVHGVGDHRTDTVWLRDWSDAILSGLRRWNPNVTARFQPVLYDDLFDAAKLDAATVAAAIWKLTTSGIVHGIGDFFRRRQRGLRDIPSQLRWTAGMVAQWADDADLRAKTRRRIEQDLAAFKPDVIVAHSLGSLVTYDTFRQNPELVRGRFYITLGSQIGNPFVRSTFGGRIAPLPPARNWYHLYNEEDNAFAHELRIIADNFDQVLTEFEDDALDHDAVRYLSHANAIDGVWRELTVPAPADAPQGRAVSKALGAFRVATRKPQQRALLIGINEYQNPADRLEGCVNDVFRVSAALQESGFAPEDIRVVFDDRATTAGILERLHWLLDGVCPGDVRFLYYSGHGAQVPSYGVNNQVDHVNECLVPYDFDWNAGQTITDQQFFEFYSQLPYDSHFIAVFDCCHSGGLTRQGGHKVRGLTPPDDVRHRSLMWDIDAQMWAERDLRELGRAIGGTVTLTDKGDEPEWTGTSGVELRLGRANALRLPKAQQEQRKKEYDHLGPFMPIILQACKADQLAYEYRDGVTSYGAFTFALTTALRQSNSEKKPLSWQDLVKRTEKVLERLKYEQTPCLVGPTKVIAKPVPFGHQPRTKRRSK